MPVVQMAIACGCTMYMVPCMLPGTWYNTQYHIFDQFKWTLRLSKLAYTTRTRNTEHEHQNNMNIALHQPCPPNRHHQCRLCLHAKFGNPTCLGPSTGFFSDIVHQKCTNVHTPPPHVQACWMDVQVPGTMYLIYRCMLPMTLYQWSMWNRYQVQLRTYTWYHSLQ